jgi:hypothetical protein
MLLSSPIPCTRTSILGAQTQLRPALRCHARAEATWPSIRAQPLRPALRHVRAAAAPCPATPARLLGPDASPTYCRNLLWQWLTDGATVPRSTLERDTLQVARQALAATTWQSRHCLFRRFVQARAALNHEDVGAQLAMFVQAQQVTPQSRLTYAKTLSAIASSLGWEVPLLRLYMSGLRKQGAEAPLHQATPISRRRMRQVIEATQDAHTRAALFVAWKTASRWADILTLTKESFVQLSDNQVVIEWSHTKSSTQGDFNPWRWTVIHDALPMCWLLRIIRGLRRHQPLTTIPTENVPPLLQRFGGDYTAHSVKRGAVDHLVREAAAGRLDMQLIPLLAKHQNPGCQLPPAVTLRYAGDKVSLALMLGTQRATMLL